MNSNNKAEVNGHLQRVRRLVGLLRLPPQAAAGAANGGKAATKRGWGPGPARELYGIWQRSQDMQDALAAAYHHWRIPTVETGRFTTVETGRFTTVETGRSSRQVKMRQASWQTCSDPREMLYWLRHISCDFSRKAALYVDWLTHSYFGAQLETKADNPEWRHHSTISLAIDMTAAADGRLAPLIREIWGDPWAFCPQLRWVAKDEPRVWHNDPIVLGGLQPLQTVRDWVGGNMAWHNNLVQRLADGIYDERAFDRLPILADALEEAGVVNSDLLYHLRGSTEHHAGCWALDAVLMACGLIDDNGCRVSTD